MRDAPEHDVGDLAAAPVAHHDEVGLQAFGQAGKLGGDIVGLLEGELGGDAQGLADSAAWRRTGSASSSRCCDGPSCGFSRYTSSANREKCTKAARAPRLAAKRRPTWVACREAGEPSTPMTTYFMTSVR